MKLLNWWDRQSPIQALAIVMGVFVLAALIAAVGRVPEARPAGGLVFVYATPAPTQPLPTADTRELEALRARVAELEQERRQPAPEPVYQVLTVQEQATPAPAAGYVAHTTKGNIVVPPDATPVPSNKPYTGPFLAPVLPAPSGPRVCDGFGDWRDYDGAYERSPACHKAGP